MCNNFAALRFVNSIDKELANQIALSSLRCWLDISNDQSGNMESSFHIPARSIQSNSTRRATSELNHPPFATQFSQPVQQPFLDLNRVSQTEPAKPKATQMLQGFFKTPTPIPSPGMTGFDTPASFKTKQTSVPFVINLVTDMGIRQACEAVELF